MNILFLSTRSPYPLISGHSLRTYHILRGAAKQHKVTLVTFVQLDKEMQKENLDHLKSFCHEVHQFRIPTDLSKAKLVTALFRNLFSPLPFVAQKYDSSEMRQKIKEIIKKEKIDLVHADLLHLAVYLDEFADSPKVIVNHNVESVRLERWFQSESNLIKKIFLGLQCGKLRKFERSAMENFDSCVVVSEIDKQILQDMGVKNKKLYVVTNGTDTEFFKPTGRETIENSILWIGNMGVHTNRDAVLYFWREIYPFIQKNNPEVKMIFVGTAPPKEIADAATNNEQVRVTGFVDDIRPYIEEAAVMVVPIRIGSGTRLKILDAMGMGKAIVSTAVGCEGLNVSDGKDILIADDPEDFAAKTNGLLKDKETRHKLEVNARELAKSYDWRQIQEKQEAIYQELVVK